MVDWQFAAKLNSIYAKFCYMLCKYYMRSSPIVKPDASKTQWCLGTWRKSSQPCPAKIPSLSGERISSSEWRSEVGASNEWSNRYIIHIVILPQTVKLISTKFDHSLLLFLKHCTKCSAHQSSNCTAQHRVTVTNKKLPPPKPHKLTDPNFQWWKTYNGAALQVFSR